MSTAQHIEWLNLVEKTGPFLAVGVLDDACSQRLEVLPTRKKQRIRSAYDEWRDAVDEGDPQLDALHAEWIRLVLFELLEYDASVLKSKDELPETISYHEPLSGAKIRPDWAVLSEEKPRLLVSSYGPATRLDAPIAEESWTATPVERMTTLCRALGVRVGLVTNGEEWVLVSVPAEGATSFGTWYARIWQQEPITLQAFISLLDVRRCFGPKEGTLDTLFSLSLEHQHEVTDTLGEQVRRAVEVLVQALDRADLDRNRELLHDVSPTQLYEAGLTVMMRLVVLLCAEERGLLLLGEPIYEEYYAVSTLRGQLLKEKEQLGEDVLERRHDAWSRLLATFRGVFGGIEHETLRLPALGGSLFDPDRFPFLEGRGLGTSWRNEPATPLPIDNRTVLMLLTALEVLEHSSGAQLLSYEALDVEQIGHVYEGLLERTVKRVEEATLGLIGSQKVINPNIPLRELEEAGEIGGQKLLALLVEKTGRSESGLKNALAKPSDDDFYHHVLIACGGDISLAERIKPFTHLLRTDSWGAPLVYQEQSFVVTLGANRRETGTHYTPKSLTEPIVQHTLEPLVYIGPAEGIPTSEWRLKSSREILALKVCDMAMGSGAFLVQTCRWLGDRLIEAWDMDERLGRSISIEGETLDEPAGFELLPRDKGERQLIARRLIASRCLYGVDINPMAVELAKLSLWLVTMMKNRPFSFLDHAFKCGDSLLGISRLEQLEHFSLRDPEHAEPLLETANLWRRIGQAADIRRKLEKMPSHTSAQIAEKARLHDEAKTQLAKLKAAADFLIAAELDCPGERGWDTRRAIAASHMQTAWKKDLLEFQRLAHEELRGRQPFHWPLEFPEVFLPQKDKMMLGFDAFVGNPPFMGGRQMPGALGFDYTDPLRAFYEIKGPADLVCYFFRRAYDLLTSHGIVGLLATNSISETVNAGASLACILESGGDIIRAVKEMPWPGNAAVVVSTVHFTKVAWRGSKWLNGMIQKSIAASLDPADTGKSAFPLITEIEYSQGTNVYGEPFIRTESEIPGLLNRNPGLNPFIRRYVSGDILNETPEHQSELYAIDFGELDEADIHGCTDILNELKTKVAYERRNQIRQIHEARPWLHWDKRARFYKLARKNDALLAMTIHSIYFVIHRVDPNRLFNHGVELFATDDFGVFGILQSSIHEYWARFTSGSLGVTTRYTASKCFETFPFPYSKDDHLVSIVAKELFSCRQVLMQKYSSGSNALYERFHDPEVVTEDIVKLRGLHEKLDKTVTKAYCWDDLDLGYGFHKTKQGMRYTISESARQGVLCRLLALNHQRYEEEVKAGLHDKKKKASVKSRTRKQNNANLAPEFGF